MTWETEKNQAESIFEIKLPEGNVTMVMCTVGQAQSPEFYERVKQATGKRITHVAKASGSDDVKYPVPNEFTYHPVPMYYQGQKRDKGLADFYQACREVAGKLDQAVAAHCNNSFHRGPALVAAVMVLAGYSQQEAFEHIAKKRIIYRGHSQPFETWPWAEQESGGKLKSCHEWISKLPNWQEYLSEHRPANASAAETTRAVAKAMPGHGNAAAPADAGAGQTKGVWPPPPTAAASASSLFPPFYAASAPTAAASASSAASSAATAVATEDSAATGGSVHLDFIKKFNKDFQDFAEKAWKVATGSVTEENAALDVIADVACEAVAKGSDGDCDKIADTAIETIAAISSQRPNTADPAPAEPNAPDHAGQPNAVDPDEQNPWDPAGQQNAADSAEPNAPDPVPPPRYGERRCSGCNRFEGNLKQCWECGNWDCRVCRFWCTLCPKDWRHKYLVCGQCYQTGRFLWETRRNVWTCARCHQNATR